MRNAAQEADWRTLSAGPARSGSVTTGCSMASCARIRSRSSLGLLLTISGSRVVESDVFGRSDEGGAKSSATAADADSTVVPCEGPIEAGNDDLPTRETLCRMLTGMGYAAHAAVNGRSALDWLAGHSAPSLILLDLLMPEMDGFQFLRELRKSRAFAEIPVIVVTAKELTAEDFGVDAKNSAG